MQEKLLKEGILPAGRNVEELQSYLKPKMDKLVELMSSEYEINVARLRKLRDE